MPLFGEWLGRTDEPLQESAGVAVFLSLKLFDLKWEWTIVAYFLKFLADNSVFIKEVSGNNEYSFSIISYTLIIVYHLVNSSQSVQYYPHFVG